MKKAILPILALLVFCLPTQAQPFRLLLSPRLGNAPFAMNTPVQAGTYEYKITRLEYYVSNIRITHDGGQDTPLTDLYLLVRTEADSVFDLGTLTGIGNVESISFSIGIDQAHNHLDPSTYPAGHPLALHNPSMHWGWAGGYRFVAMEGLVGASFDNVFEVHALGDQNYKNTTVPATAQVEPNGDRTIRLNADYARLLENIDVSQGLISHGTIDEAATLLSNMHELVFSAQTTGTGTPAFEGNFRLSANPMAAPEAAAVMSLPAGFDYRITLTDLAGRTIMNRTVADSATTLSFGNNVAPGVYLVCLWQNERPVATEKLVVTQ